MLSSNSRLRRYTPPTCTLEIWGKRSVLPWWTSYNRPHDLKFKLIFDDPKILDNEQVILEGDRNELQLLCDIVTTYVQNLLASSPDSLSLISEKGVIPWSRELVPDYPSLISALKEHGQEISFNGKERETNLGAIPPVNSKTWDYPDNTHLSVTPIPSLTPKGLLTHELDCSLLITNQNNSKILLSVSQLFDLANALEEYSLEVEVSPHFDNRKPAKKIVVWSITALVALVAVGIPTVGLKWYRSLNQETVVEPSTSSGSTIKDILPPVPLPLAMVSIPSPTLAPSLEQQKKLLPPSQLGQATSPSRNSTVAVVVPPKTALPPAPVVPPAPGKNMLVLTPNLPPNPTYSTSPSLSTLPPPPRPNTLPTLSNTPSKSANTAYVMPNPTAVPTLPKLPTLPSSSATVPPQSQLAMNSNKFNDKDDTALLDTIPQVTEARDYFQQRWQPPESLKHTLEYRLVLNSDGSIGQIFPLGKAAKIYLDRTNMPLIGEPFVSAPPDSLEKPQIRVVLSPDKTVKTFLEE